MKVTVFGGGYVGLVTGACLAQVGHDVVCADIDTDKVAQLNSGISPIFEPGLDAYLQGGLRQEHLRFTTDMEAAVAHGDVQFIAVGTPANQDGSADVHSVLAVAATIGQYLDHQAVIVTKSTVPVGTADQVQQVLQQCFDSRGVYPQAQVASNPEFLKEGAAIHDFMKPDRIVVGTDSKWVEETMRELYAPFNRNHERLMVMDVRSAELTKYAANAMLATKISFINEIANIAETVGADIEHVRQGIGADPRIGYHFIYPGCGYGGSCFPKDVRALEATAVNNGYVSHLLKAVDGVNECQKRRLFEKVHRYFDGDLAGKTFAIWGLAFKPNTDDIREAPSRELMAQLWRSGAKVKAYDPHAMDAIQGIYGHRDDLVLTGTKEAAAAGADALILCTEWKAFWAPDFAALRQQLKTPVIFDGRNLYDPKRIQEQGFDYFGIGRSARGKNVTAIAKVA
ncbi:UDP-glucose/GDP-mannose dehydrogenase family protein [bacterium SCSIO 12696]|nr:UDP-glucose/GDP-mannose dehydrogenase family protein [bacterium SCSIO 12696]